MKFKFIDKKIMKKLYLIICSLLMVCSCQNHGKGDCQGELTAKQQQLLDEGWKFDNPDNGDFPAEYGIKPEKGLFDNYFDIEIGEGFNMALKIVDVKTDATIRYVFVRENTTATISEIPPGEYYLKLAYGYDWMSFEDSGKMNGKFTKAATYEMSDDLFDFGQSPFGADSYLLRINMLHDEHCSNFSTTEIEEEDFYNDKLN